LQDQHDKIRQKPGSWQIAIETARELKAMKKQYPRLDLQTCTCFMHSNQDTIFEWYDFLKHDLKPDKVTSITFGRPQPIRLSSTSITPLREAGADDRRRFASCGDQEHVRRQGRVLQGARSIFTCTADRQDAGDAASATHLLRGTAGAVIYDEGTLSSCENLAPIGNLRDHDWNFQGLWLSDAMKARRKQAPTAASARTSRIAITRRCLSIRSI
jgi:MoaA/NifB/PqqE/SkfB family radical SAM enzyme